MLGYLKKQEISDRYPLKSWQSIVYAEMEATLESASRLFPCIYGVTGLRTNNLRFAFLDEVAPDVLAPVLEQYLPDAHSRGRYASLVVFEKPGAVRSMQDYRKKFWSILDGLTLVDNKDWPSDIPTAMDHPKWEFCFAGEPMFVVCNTPAHVERQSRRSSGFMMTFQPRWVFDGITSTDRAAEAAFSTVRKRLVTYDMLSPSPVLGRYGDPAVREYAQYFIDNENSLPECPMVRMRAPSEAKKKENAKC